MIFCLYFFIVIYKTLESLYLFIIMYIFNLTKIICLNYEAKQQSKTQ